MNTKMGHVGSKIRSLGQILEKPCLCSRDQIFGLILMKLGLSVCLDESCTCLKIGYVGSKGRSLCQIIKDPMLVVKGFLFKFLLLNVIPHNPESSGERLLGHDGPLVIILSRSSSKVPFRVMGHTVEIGQ